MIKIEKIGTPPKTLTDVSVLFGLKAKGGASMAKQVVEKLVEEVLQKTGDEAESYFDKIMATWGDTYQHDKNVNRILDKGNNWSLFVYVNDKIFLYLNEGTTKKAAMRPGFRAKTSFRNYSSTRGSPPYDPQTYVDKSGTVRVKIRKGDGIKAREWTTQMAYDLEPILRNNLTKAFSKVGKVE